MFKRTKRIAYISVNAFIAVGFVTLAATSYQHEQAKPVTFTQAQVDRMSNFVAFKVKQYDEDIKTYHKPLKVRQAEALREVWMADADNVGGGK